ncbi:energy-coupling factor ABC transporter ATP-binding protein [Persephonella sp.]
MIELKNLSYKYGEKYALKDINLTVNKGEKIVILGVNGSGKSTLLKVINGLIFPDTGEYFYKGRKITKKAFRDKNFAKNFRKEVVLLFQNPDSMLFNPTVYDEIAFGLRQLGIEGKDRIKNWAERLRIDHILSKSPFDLSGGEKQKVCLASLLILEPEVLLLDEPTANLDPASTDWLVEFLSGLDKTIITTTHNLYTAGYLGKRAVVLDKDHKVLYDGDMKSLLFDKDLLKRANLIHRHFIGYYRKGEGYGRKAC